MRTQNPQLGLFASLVHLDDGVGRLESFGNLWQCKEQRVVKGGINADQVARISSVASNKAGDFLLVIVHFPKGEKVFLADAQSELAYSVAKDTGALSVKVLQGVDPKAVNVELGNQILIGANQNFLHVGIACQHLFEGSKVADDLVAPCLGNALPTKRGIAPQLCRPHGPIGGWIGNSLCHRPVQSWDAMLIAPSN